MFFVISKVFWALVQPLSATLLLAVLGGILIAFGKRRLGLVAGALGVLVLGLTGFTTLGALMIGPLEDRFERPAQLPATVSAIVMLGGASSGTVSAARGTTELTVAGDRFVETLRLAQLYPQAKVVVTGGVGSIESEGETEAATAERFFTGLGIAPERLVLEDQARNTAENADFTVALLGELDGPAIMVTSAFHMPRSMGLFRKAGLEMLPWPTDYRSTGEENVGFDIRNPVDNLTTATTAIKEWIGLLVYHWTGKIDELVPAPHISN